MIDLHSHILAEVDDGASSIEESIKILKMMEAKGVKKITATSHFPIYNEGNYKDQITEKLNLLKKKAADNNLKIEILSGSEIMIDRKIPKLLYNDQLLTINNTDYLLLETRFNDYPDYFFDLIHDIKAMGYQVIIAHPERYSYIQSDHTILYQWIEEYDLKLMFNSSSLLGRHGKKSKETAEKLLELGLCHLMASDTHGIDKRPFTLDQGLKKAEQLKPGSAELMRANSRAVVNNQQLKNFKIKKEKKSFIKKVFSFIK